VVAIAAGITMRCGRPSTWNPGDSCDHRAVTVSPARTFQLLVVAAIGGCAGPPAERPDAAAIEDGPAAEDAPAPAVRVLFVGNSYTGVNDLPAMVRSLGETAPSPVRYEIAQHTPGGTAWEDHDGDPAVTALIAEGWDHVVLQDQSAQPWIVNGVKPALVSLDAKVRAAGGSTVLYMTWARRVDGKDITEVTRFLQDMYINRYYVRHAEVVGARVAPVGRAWERALRDPAMVLHQADGSHPELPGTYLAACLVHATITGQSPIGLGDGGTGLDAAELARLQQIARDTLDARAAPASPLVGAWPLAATAPGNDLVRGGELVLGDTTGPDGTAGAATTFARGRYAAIPYGAALNTPHITVALHAHRADWTAAPAFTQYLVGKWYGYQLVQEGTALVARVSTVDELEPPSISAPLDGLSPGWHRFALTHDGAAFALWIDGARVASGPASGDLRYYAASPDDLGRFAGVAVGGPPSASAESTFAGSSPYAFDGALADLRIHDRALVPP
jgi:hypothetical protein